MDGPGVSAPLPKDGGARKGRAGSWRAGFQAASSLGLSMSDDSAIIGHAEVAHISRLDQVGMECGAFSAVISLNP
jgi:hypothetical protein